MSAVCGEASASWIFPVVALHHAQSEVVSWNQKDPFVFVRPARKIQARKAAVSADHFDESLAKPGDFANLAELTRPKAWIAYCQRRATCDLIRLSRSDRSFEASSA